jgi:hypothetical protein
LIIRQQPAIAPIATEPSPAWPAVERIQRSTSPVYHLVTQPDHAQISGLVAANFSRTLEPDLTPEIIRAIALHDHGWSQFEGNAHSCLQPLTDRSGRPLCFLDASPAIFLQAWSGSIHAASETGAVGEYIVSSHFRMLAERRLRSVTDPPESQQRIRDFIGHQALREIDLLPATMLSKGQLERLLKLLQFCDILSLVICSAAPGTLDFADDFCVGPLRLSPTSSGYALTGRPTLADAKDGISPLTAPVRFALPLFEFRQNQLVPLPQLQLTVC